VLTEGEQKCHFCQKTVPQDQGQIKNEEFYCIPCASKLKCQQCQQWYDQELGKIDDQEGVWFCNKCWRKWEKSQHKTWTQQDPDRYMSNKMRKIEKDWLKGGSW